MSQDYDSQLLESVSVRRRRLRDALLHGAQRGRRRTDEGLGKAFAGVVLAAVVCAGCVGWSFVSDKLGEQGSSESGVGPGQVPTGVTGSAR
ncbi:hypothetical protein [Streptomyces palmae]|uniref:Uncharacterized protein n=1 Tax=Streptomyces palmae TaxID=1701085 RepID=A0A4Z0HDM0_9ACTN|nr:hypothetical protein [Streptomyces palmae]TGB11234.1 hypothetical protein E4099_12130 [Streptomyces palmae]